MNYIQNKLDEFDKEFPNPLYDDFILGSPEITESLKAFIKQAITDYHNYIVEKVKNEPNPFMGENDKKDHHTGWEYAKKDILSLLQDTNPKE